MNTRLFVSYGAGVWIMACALALTCTGCQEEELVGGSPRGNKVSFRIGVADS